MHCSALSDISIFMEHCITIRYSTSVSIYCDIDMYCRSLIRNKLSHTKNICRHLKQQKLTIKKIHIINHECDLFFWRTVFLQQIFTVYIAKECIRNYIHTYVRTYVCMYVCTYVRTYVYMYVSIYICMYVRIIKYDST